MVSKVNIRARIKRHSNYLENPSLPMHTKIWRKTSYIAVIILWVFAMPFYPVIASFFYNTSPVEFDRSSIDVGSILDSSIWWEELNSLVVKDEFFSVNSLIEEERDFDWISKSFDYTVSALDTLSSVAEKFQVKKESILWANSFEPNKNLIAGEIIKIPPVSWIYHTLWDDETLLDVARRYNIELWKIESQNLITQDSVSFWDQIFVPGADKSFPVQYMYKDRINWGYTFSSNRWSEIIGYDWAYKLTRRIPERAFVWGNCTYFVAKYKNVNWSWNANDWYKNAKSKWVATWHKPWLGSIVVFDWKWYNPRYWHVAIVTDIKEDHIVVKDMNYRRLNEVTTRKVPINDRAIVWYIYAED